MDSSDIRMDAAELAAENRRLDHVVSVISGEICREEELRDALKGDNILLNRLMWDDTPKAITDFDDAAAMPMYLSEVQQIAYRRERNARRLDFLNRIIDAPWFARISFREEGESEPEQFYIGVGNVNDPDGEVLVIDWRADISSLYYDGEIGPASYTTRGFEITGELTARRQYKIADRRIRFMFDSSVAIEDALLMDLLQQNASAHMKNVVSTIQREQNTVIKCAPRGVLSVSGPAGSGKTSIAMHRIAYLMYRERARFNSGSVIILSPNNIFNDYISDVLPSLGEDPVPSRVFLDCLPELPLPEEVRLQSGVSFMNLAVSGISRERGISVAIKSSPSFADAIEAFISDDRIGRRRFRDITDGDEVIFSAEDMRGYYYTGYSGMTPQMRMNRIRNAGITAITEWAERESRRLFLEETGSNTVLGDGSEVMQRCRAAVRGRVQEHITELHRITVFNTFAMYSYLLRHLPVFIGKDRYGAGGMSDASKVFFDSVEQGVMPYEDTCAYALMCLMLGVIEPDREKFHVVIDEAQDYSFLQFRLLRLLYPDASFTCLGDPNQRVNPYTGDDNMGTIPEAFRGVGTTCLRLARGFRSTTEIAEYCAGILGGPAADNVVRHGRQVEESVTGSRDELIARIRDILRDIPAGSGTAVICRNGDEARSCGDMLRSKGIDCVSVLSDKGLDGVLERGGVSVMPVFMSKGLEFDNVIIENAGDYGQDRADRQLLYTACSRALHRLYVNTVSR